MKNEHTHTHTPRLLLLLAALCLCASAAAQTAKEGAKPPAEESKPNAAQRAEAGRLRAALEAAVAGHFEVVRERRAGGYWLAHLRAARPGDFQLRYRYRYRDHFKPQDPLYTFVEHETGLRVGPRGCLRRPRHNSVCVGDTVIVPVVVNDYTEHTFALASNPYEPLEEAFGESWRAAEEAGLHRAPVENPAAAFLKYVGNRAHYSPHRLAGYTLEFYATFEAVGTGSFNLGLGVSRQGAAPAEAAWAAEAAAASAVPVVVVGRGAPVTILSSNEYVRGYTERFSSGSGNNYPTTPVILQVGERLTLKYSGYSHRGRTPGGENREALEATVRHHAPAIALLPFHVDPALDFNEWLVEFLPPARRR